MKNPKKQAKKVYDKIIQNQLKHLHGNRPRNWSQLCSGKYHNISCVHAVTIYLKNIDCIKGDHLVGHTDSGKYKNKDTKTKAIMGWRYLKNCKIVHVNKYFEDLPKKYKKAGVVYVYDSDVSIFMGDNNIIASCNKHGYTMTKSNVYHRGGYDFNHRILYVIIPDLIDKFDAQKQSK